MKPHDLYPELDVDREQERVRLFVEAVSAGLPIKEWEPVIHLDADDPIVDGIQEFYALGRKTGLLLDRSIIVDGAESEDTDVYTAGFNPRRSRAGKNSVHGVFFGDIILSTGQVVSLAVKPHSVENNERSALTDMLSTHIVEQLGFYTLKPAGVLLQDDPVYDTAYSLTVLDEGLTTFDSIEWTHFATDLSKNPGMREQWRAVANQVAVLHDSGQACHGDLAARNVATSGDGGAFLIDWEKARFSGIPPRDAEVRYQFSYADISVLLESMARSPRAPFKPGIGLLNERSGDWWATFKEVFLDDYFITRRILAEQGRHNRHRAHDIEEELKVLEDTLRHDCEMFFEMHTP